MERSDLTLIYTASDFGERAFIVSLLEANNIVAFCPDQHNEAIAFMRSSFNRQFSIYVAPKDAERAKELIADHNQDKGEPPTPAS